MMIKKTKFKLALPKKDMVDFRFLLAQIRCPVEENPLKEIERLLQLRKNLSTKIRTVSPVVKAVFYFELAARYGDLQWQAHDAFQGPCPWEDGETSREKADCLLEAKEALFELDGGPYPHINVQILNYIGILEAIQGNARMAKMAFKASINALSRCGGETEDLRNVIEANLRTVDEQPRSPVYNRLLTNFKIK